jgi:hypothetical protein
MGVFGRHADESVEDERTDAEDRAVAEDRTARLEDRTEGERVRIPTGRATVTDTVPTTRPDTTTAPAVVSPVYSGRTSFFAALGLILGVTAVYASLSGRLAPVGVAAGVLGVLLSGGGLAAGTRRGVSGRGVAMLGMLLSLAGVVLAILAMNNVTSWLNSDVDQVSKARDWLNMHLTWLKSW